MGICHSKGDNQIIPQNARQNARQNASQSARQNASQSARQNASQSAQCNKIDITCGNRGTYGCKKDFRQ